MGDKLVTDLPLSNGGGGEISRPSLFRYTDFFEQMCAYYMFLGMSYHDYWNGDNDLPKYYRQKDELYKQRKNSDLWLQGLYFYESLLCASPVLNPLSKNKKPMPYRDMPIPITKSESRQQEEIKKQKQLEAGREAMRMMMNEFNAKFLKKQEGGKTDNGD